MKPCKFEAGRDQALNDSPYMCPLHHMEEPPAVLQAVGAVVKHTVFIEETLI